MALQPPVEPMLAQARDTLPGPRALPGGLAYEPNGYRALVFTPGTKPGPVRVQLRRGNLVQARFPELVTAGAHLPEGLVLDGELVVWTGHQIATAASAAEPATSSTALNFVLPDQSRRDYNTIQAVADAQGHHPIVKVTGKGSGSQGPPPLSHCDLLRSAQLDRDRALRP
jgi:hypothetical protein